MQSDNNIVSSWVEFHGSASIRDLLDFLDESSKLLREIIDNSASDLIKHAHTYVVCRNLLIAIRYTSDSDAHPRCFNEVSAGWEDEENHAKRARKILNAVQNQQIDRIKCILTRHDLPSYCSIIPYESSLLFQCYFDEATKIDKLVEECLEILSEIKPIAESESGFSDISVSAISNENFDLNIFNSRGLSPLERPMELE